MSKNIKKDDIDKNKPLNQNIYDSLGYWEKRKDFDVEFKNEAEIQLSEIEFKDGDSPEDVEYNFKSLKNYNNILDEREERKKLVLEKIYLTSESKLTLIKNYQRKIEKYSRILNLNINI